MALPVVTSIAPSSGPIAGGTTVTIVGTDLTTPTGVSFGATAATVFGAASATEAFAVAPAHVAAAVDVTYTTAGGTSATSSADTFTYGQMLFSVAEARAFDKAQLNDVDLYPDADIVAKEAEIRQSFEDVICGIHFNPTVITDYRDANRTRQLWLTHHNPLLESPPRQITVSSVLIDGGNGVGAGHTFTPAELADLACYPDGRVIRKTLGYWISSFPYGELAVQITYTVGYATVPPDINRAALLVCVEQMTKKNLSDRLKSYSDETGSYELYMPGASNSASVYGIPEVTTILNNYAEDPVSVG